jgi:hypothetical protein
MEKRVRFRSGGHELAGILHRPDDMEPGERRGAFLVLHGFGANKDEASSPKAADLMSALGYVTLRFDMRGCGDSGGERGRVIYEEEIEDTLAALEFVAELEEVEAGRIAAVGASYGAAVAIHAASADKRLGAVIASGGWGNGDRTFRRLHPTPPAWGQFCQLLEDGRRYRDEGGEDRLVPRFDIVPIPKPLRANLGPSSIMEFHLETALSMYEANPEDAVAGLAPTPLLILHNAQDTVISDEEAIELYRRAEQPADLHVFSAGDHFMFSDDDGQVAHVIQDWLSQHFPLRGDG